MSNNNENNHPIDLDKISQLNTHSYDFVVGSFYHQLIKNDPAQNLISFEESIKQIEKWLDESQIPNKQYTVTAINLLKNDLSGNYDERNNIHVEELLPRVIDVVKDFDQSAREGFLTVLGEIVAPGGGACSQGRTTRLLSYYTTFKY